MKHPFFSTMRMNHFLKSSKLCDLKNMSFKIKRKYKAHNKAHVLELFIKISCEKSETHLKKFHFFLLFME